MSKKDYILIANVLNAHRPDPSFRGLSAERYLGHMQARQAIAQSLAAALAIENPRFSSGRFLEACGLDL